MKRSIFLIVISLVITGITSSYAQKRKLTLKENADTREELITTQLPNISRWNDDEHYIENFRMGEPPNLVDAKTGERSPFKYTPPKSIKVEKQENLLFSPDSTWAAYTLNNNLYAVEIATGRKVQYTTDGSDVILNGKPSWVYYEEILKHSTRSFWWSPDGKYIAFFRTDESNVPLFPIFNTEGQHGTLKQTRYPKAGDPNPEIQVGIVSVEGGPIVWADFNWKEDQYFGTPFWTPDSKSLWIQWMPRKQNQLKIYAIDITSGKKNEVYNETEATWVNWKEDIYFLQKQEAYLIQNTTDGWDQIYLYKKDGSLKKKVTSGKNFWNTKILHIDEPKQTIYFTSYGETTIQCDLYSIKLDGSSLKRLSFGDYHHMVQLSPSAKYFITRYSNPTTPACIDLVDARTGKIIRQLANSKSETFDSLELTQPKIIWYTTSDGLKLPAVIIFPAEMDTTKKHPVSIYTYGGPNSPVVQNRWWGGASWESHEGIISVILDHRGSGHCGKKGTDYLYRNLGKYEMSDFIDFIKGYLYPKSYIDREKITIRGHSYGGYLTALALTKGAEYFKIGIADAGVMDWKLYDSHYTERYMDTPENNPEGYKESSVLNYVDNYKAGNMLYIRHGLADDNVHPQNSIQLINLLQLQDKPFEMTLYPGCSHSFIGPKLTTTYNDAIRFWYHYLLGKEAPDELIKKDVPIRRVSTPKN